MPANYVLLGTQTVCADVAARVTFINILQSGYTDLKVVYSTRTTASSTSGNDIISINGSTSSFSGRRLYGSGSSAASDTVTTWVGFNSANNGTASTFSNSEIVIPNYTSGNNKSFSIDTVQEQNGTAAYSALSAGLWSNTSAITSITFTPDSGNYAAGSTFYLYGLAQVGTTPAIAPLASGGDVVVNDGTYWYHAFKATGAFVPAKALSADILVVAGGGGGGGTSAGGGGAGGLLGFTSQNLALNTSYTCTVGAGGSAAAVNGQGGVGTDSQFGALTLVKGGGGGGGYSTTAGATGGSGGGGANGGNGGSATSGQGNAGGNSWTHSGGGGGGASAAGTTAVSGVTAGNGGNGSSAYSAWGLATATGQNVSSTYYYAGGGGGGANTQGNGAAGSGGSGGGGQGGNDIGQSAVAGTANTGGGGGGSRGNGSYAGTAGGSGIVIIRYAMA